MEEFIGGLEFDIEEFGIPEDGFNSIEAPEEEPEEEEIAPYRKLHVLLSFHPDVFRKIKDQLIELKETEGVEYEESAN